MMSRGKLKILFCTTTNITLTLVRIFEHYISLNNRDANQTLPILQLNLDKCVVILKQPIAITRHVISYTFTATYS